MTTKEQAIAMLEGRIDTIQSLCKECIDMLYITAYNEAIEAAAAIADQDHGSYCEEVGNDIRKLKK